MATLMSAWKDRRGAAAAEFALILPGLLFLLFGIFNLCVATYAEMCLQSAVESAARYASVTAAANSSDSNLSTLVPAYAQHHYMGPAVTTTPTFVTTGTCQVQASPGYEGYQVAWTGAYKVYYGFGTLPFTLSAKACFP